MSKILPRVDFYHELAKNAKEIVEEHEENLGGMCTSYLEWLKSLENKQQKIEANKWLYILIIYHKYYTEDSTRERRSESESENDELVSVLIDDKKGLSLHSYSTKKFINKDLATLTYTLPKLSTELRGVLLGYMLFCLSSQKIQKEE